MSKLTAAELKNLPENPDTGIAEAGKDVLLYLGKVEAAHRRCSPWWEASAIPR